MAFPKPPIIKGTDPTEPGTNEDNFFSDIIGHMFRKNEAEEPIRRALVTDVITNPEVLYKAIEDDPEYLDNKNLSEAGRKVALQAPRNSLFIKLLDDRVTSTVHIAIPFFSSHVMFPVSPGEQVWVIIMEDHIYWMSRIPGVGSVEDVNYSHKDREFITPAPYNPNAKEKQDSETGGNSFVPINNDGAGGEYGETKNVAPGFEPMAIQEGVTLQKQTYEPVPRWTPRVGDLVLQGSNNTLISLGTDRGWNKSDEDFSASNADGEIEADRGTIDIVVGRSYLEESPTETTEGGTGSDPNRTKPRLAQTRDGGIEVDKISRLNDQPPNPAEGDPDFYFDASRLYVSTKSAIDEKLALKDEYREPFEGEYTDVENSAIAIKTNEIRIIGREDGSIRILKEKGENGKSASIVLMADGTIHIQGEKIFVGEKGAQGEGPGESEPYVIHSEIKSWCESTSSSIQSFCQTVMGHTTPGYGVPSPQITSAASTLLSDMIKHDLIIPNFPSKRIFGE